MLYADALGNLMSSGVITVGYFQTGFNVASNLNNPLLLAANFVVLSSGSPGSFSNSLGGPFPGYVEELVPGPVFGDGNPNIGKNLYSMVGNGQSLSSSNNIALVDLQTTIASDVPAEFTYSSDPMGKPILLGSAGTFTGNPAPGSLTSTGTYQTLKLSTVPEPSAIIAGLLGVLPLLRRRR